LAIRKPTVVLDLELGKPFPLLSDLHRYGDALVLCRLHGRPLGFVRVPIDAARVSPDDCCREAIERHAWGFAIALAERRLSAPDTQAVDVASLVAAPARPARHHPLVTVAVCTRDRADDLRLCLDALRALDYPALDILVVDNAPATSDTERLVHDHYPAVRYVREPRPGLDWARNRAILECRGEILAYTDDDVVVDRAWVSALVDVFTADRDVMAVTGLVIPHELETEAQRLFETYGGFGRGFLRRWYRAPSGRAVAPLHGGTGKFGTGANMAFRRELFDRIGGFDPALDVGTCTNGGGDLEMFFRVLKTGHTLVYEPAALVRHRHRRGYPQLRTQLANNGVGFYSYLTRTAAAYRDERNAVLRLGLWWLQWWNLRRLLRGMLGKEPIPLDLMLAELVGSFRGLRRYNAAQKRVHAIRATYPEEPEVAPPATVTSASIRRVPEAVRMIDLTEPLQPLTDVGGYERVRVVASRGTTPIGSVVLEHHGAVVSPAWLRDAITQHLTWDVLGAGSAASRGVLWATLVADLARVLTPAPLHAHTRHRAPAALPEDIAVSVVVATYDRPADLTRCLRSLTSQQTQRPLQIIVVDNHPASRVTRDVVAQFPGALLVEEQRGGLSYARNRGIAAASGDIIVCTDDDVVCPPDWIERLVAPFRQQDVMVVTGNVLPLELENDAQRMFEAYGGLSRGFSPFRVDGDWFIHGRRSVPTWELGCTANAAFRASIFSDPDIGLMDEALGAGTPTGCSEDTYVFYRVLKSGFAIVYEPDAYVWHRHRNTVAALKRQIYAYSKGHVAYQLTTWWVDGDRRALVRLGYELPRTYVRRALARMRGRSEYPLSFIALEILGNLAGPFALWQSRRRVRRLGRSALAPARPATAGSDTAAAAA
jgi:GT2 family glycosyltransferase